MSLIRAGGNIPDLVEVSLAGGNTMLPGVRAVGGLSGGRVCVSMIIFYPAVIAARYRVGREGEKKK